MLRLPGSLSAFRCAEVGLEGPGFVTFVAGSSALGFCIVLYANPTSVPRVGSS